MDHHLLNGAFISASEHDHAHTVGSRLANRCRVSIGIESVFELFVDFLILSSHSNESQSEADTMLHRLDLTSVLVPVHEELICLRSEDICMDETICIVCTSCAVGRVVWAIASGEVRG